MSFKLELNTVELNKLLKTILSRCTVRVGGAGRKQAEQRIAQGFQRLADGFLPPRPMALKSAGYRLCCPVPPPGRGEASGRQVGWWRWARRHVKRNSNHEEWKLSFIPETLKSEMPSEFIAFWITRKPWTSLIRRNMMYGERHSSSCSSRWAHLSMISHMNGVNYSKRKRANPSSVSIKHQEHEFHNTICFDFISFWVVVVV